MLTGKFTLLKWIWVWGTLTLMFAWLTQETQSLWTFITVIVTFLIMITGIVYHWSKRSRRKYNLRHQPFEGLYWYTAASSPRNQDILLSLQMKTRITIEFMTLSFEGQGTKPIIKGLYNCVSGRILKDTPISVNSIIDGSWICQNQPTFQQSDIGLAVEFIAEEPFDGVLKFDLKCDEVDRIIYDIPFKVTEVMELYNGKLRKVSLLRKAPLRDRANY